MRKILFFYTLLIFGSNIYALISKSYVNIGPEYHLVSNSNGGIQPLGTHKNMVGFSITGYGFWSNPNIGIFINGSWVFPVYTDKHKLETSNYIEYTGYKQTVIPGIGFSYPLGNNFMALAGIGPFVGMDVMNCTLDKKRKHSITVVDLGFAGQIGFQFNITRKVHIMAGYSLTYGFTNYTEVEETYTGKKSGWTFDPIFGNRFFIGAGVNISKK